MNEPDRDSRFQIGCTLAGLSVGGGLLTGVAGLFGAVVEAGNGELISSGIFLVAAALAFGLVAQAVYRP